MLEVVIEWVAMKSRRTVALVRSEEMMFRARFGAKTVMGMRKSTQGELGGFVVVRYAFREENGKGMV